MKLKKVSLSFALASLLLPGLALAGPKEDVEAAAKKVADAENYSWTTTVEMGGNNDRTPRPVTGKTRKDGVSLVTMTGRDDKSIDMVVKGDTVVMKVEDEWKTGEEMAAARAASRGEGGENSGRGRGGRGSGGMMRGMKAPAASAVEIIAKVEGLEEKDGALTGKLTEAGVKEMLTFGGRGRRGGEGEGAPDAASRPEPTDTSGEVTFWMKDGALTKMVVHVKGKITFGERNMDIDRTTTTEISEVGTTAIEIPAAAAGKLEGAKTEEAK